jgi:WD40 repeat protein
VLEFWDLETDTNRERVVEALAMREVSAIGISPDHWLIAFAWHDENEHSDGVIVQTLADGNLLWTSASFTDRINGLTFSPDRQWLVAACMDQKVQLLSMESGAKVREIGCQGTAESVTFSRDGKLIAVPCWDATRLYSFPDCKPVTSLPGSSYKAIFSADGNTLITHGQVNANWWHLPTGRQMFSTSVPSSEVPAAMFLLADENFVAGCFARVTGPYTDLEVFQLLPLERSQEWLRSQPMNPSGVSTIVDSKP